MKTTVHNLKRERMSDPRTDVYIGRASSSRDRRFLGHSGYFGNPFSAGSKQDNIQRFRAYAEQRIQEDQAYNERVTMLAGKRLFCFCAPEGCHGDVLAEIAERLYVEMLADTCGGMC